MKKTVLVLSALLATLAMPAAFAQEEQATQQISTTVKAPSYFLTYSYYKYDLQGTNNANTRIYGFDASTVDLNMITATWLYSPQWTLLAFVPHIKNMVETKYEPIPGGLNFKTRDYTEGLGDVRLMAMTALHAADRHLFLGDISVTLPTGSIDETFTSNPSQNAAYNMQLGSGTPDLILGSTYTYTPVAKWVNSARGQVTVRGGRNSSGWALGNEFVTTLSSKYQVAKYFEFGVAGNYKARDAAQGRDAKYELNNNWNGTAKGDGHQYYHAPQINWDTEFVAKLTSPAYYGVNGAFEGGVSFWRDAINKDDIRLDMPYWVSASVTGSF
ncbi:transporter [Bdellovibrio sp. HCB-162]|uniref:transporter n=1 Tax=Bdellovibrio sp. HCB-162 TaxID=3394234 RepID=UPI0039BD44D2